MMEFSKRLVIYSIAVACLYSCKKEKAAPGDDTPVAAYLVGRWKDNKIIYKVYGLSGNHVKDTTVLNNNNDLSDSPGEYEIFLSSGKGYHVEQGIVNGTDGQVLSRDTDFTYTYYQTRDSLKVSDFKNGILLSSVAIIHLDATEMDQQFTFSNVFLSSFNISAPNPNDVYNLVADSYWVKQP